MTLLSFILRTSRRVVVLAILAGAISGAASTGLIALIHTTLSSASVTTTLVWGFTGLCALVFASNVAARLLLIHLVQTAVFDLRMNMGRRILAAPLRHLETLGAHRLLATLTDDVSTITIAFAYVPQLCISLSIFLTSLVYLGSLSWSVLLGVLGFTILGVLSYRLLVSKALRELRYAREKWDALCHHFQALITGIKELKLRTNRRHAFLENVFEPTTASLRQHNAAGRGFYAIATIWGQLLFFICIGLLLFATPVRENLSPQALAGYVLVLLYMRAPLESLVVVLPILGNATIALQKVNNLGLLLEAQTPEVETQTQQAYRPFRDCLELVGVTCTYTEQEEEPDTFTLGPLQVAFRSGEIVFLIGGNGSGKTTFAKLLVGLYTPTSGVMRLDGQPITDENRETYRQHFSTVFSDFYLFDEFLGLDRPDLEEQARAHLDRLQLNHKVQITPGAPSTTQLSQGQRKRLALLTAYLEDRAFYVFDEWAADQEPLFKEIFYFQLLPELKARGKTVFVISHDDRYYNVADRIIKLDYGQIDSDTNPPHTPNDNGRGEHGMQETGSALTTGCRRASPASIGFSAQSIGLSHHSHPRRSRHEAASLSQK